MDDELEFEGGVLVGIAAQDRVGTGVGQRQVPGAGAAEDEGLVAALRGVRVDPREVEDVTRRAAGAVEGLAAVAGDELVDRAGGGVAGGAEAEDILPRPADQGVRACIADEQVRAGLTGEPVVPEPPSSVSLPLPPRSRSLPPLPAS